MPPAERYSLTTGDVQNVIMSAIGGMEVTTPIGRLPIMFGTETSSEVMKRIATPMVGGTPRHQKTPQPYEKHQP